MKNVFSNKCRYKSYTRMKKRPLVGPGFITAALVIGPGSITVASKIGAILGYSTLWVVMFSSILMITYTIMGAKIGIVLRESFLTSVAFKFGKVVAIFIGVSGFLVTIGFQVGNNVGVGIALKSMFGGTVKFWIIIFAFIAIFLLWSSNNVYRLLENIMTFLIAVMVVSFLINLFMAKPNVEEILRGFIPKPIPNFQLIIPISATTFSVASACFQSYLVRWKKWTERDMALALRDSIIGIITVTMITMVIMITSATILKPAGIKVNSAMEMAMQLQPLLGSLSKWLFLFGLWAGAFSSFMVSATMGGTLLADGFGLGDGMESINVKFFSSLVIIIGALITILFGENPINLLIVAQSATIIVVPVIAIIMFIFSNNKKVIRKYNNRLIANIFGILGIIWTIYLSIMELKKWI